MEYAFFLAGTLFLIFGLVFLRDRMSFLKYGTEAWASCIRIEVITYEDEDGKRTVYVPHFKVITHFDQEIKFTYGSSSKWGNWSIGDQLRVIYNDSFPGDIVVDTFVAKYRNVMALLAFAALFFIIGVLYLR